MTEKLSSWMMALLKGMNHDFCPNLNRYVYWLKRPIGWVICGALFSLLVGLLIGPQGFILMWSFIALLIIGALWPWLSMKGLTCELLFEESRGREGEPIRVILKVTNRLPLPAFGLMVSGQFLQDVWAEDDRIAVSLKRVPAWSTCQFEWIVIPKRRGELPTAVPIISTGFPFGIYCTENPVRVSGRTIVWPACHELDGVPATDGTQFNFEGCANQKSGPDGETIGVREYRHGDSIRNIHWNHTARCSRLIVREKQSLTQTPIRIVVDLQTGQHAGEGSQSTFEWAIRVAASVCQQLDRHRAGIELVCLGLASGIRSRITNQSGIQPVLDFLALLPQHTPGSTESKTSLSVQQAVSAGHFTILILTQSFDDLTDWPRVKQICIDPTEFASRSSIEVDVVEATPSVEEGTPEPTVATAITAPEFAAEQLHQLWPGGLHASH